MMSLESLSLFMRFVWNGRQFVVIRFEGNMVEVKEVTGRHWAWPKQAKVRV